MRLQIFLGKYIRPNGRKRKGRNGEVKETEKKTKGKIKNKMCAKISKKKQEQKKQITTKTIMLERKKERKKERIFFLTKKTIKNLHLSKDNNKKQMQT